MIARAGDWQYRMAYQATQRGYKYGKPENRPAKITNPNDYGALCKHLTSMLSNKKWLQQVTGTFMDWIEKRIVEINRYLRLEGENQLTLPNELARNMAKKAAYSKLFKDTEENEEETTNNTSGEEKPVKAEPGNNQKTNVQGNNPSTNKINNVNNEEEETNNEE